MGERDNDGYHALHWSCSEGQVKVVELILENSDSRKIYLNEKDDHGRTALHLACKRGQLPYESLILPHLCYVVGGMRIGPNCSWNFVCEILATVWTVNDVLVDSYPFIILVDISIYPFR